MWRDACASGDPMPEMDIGTMVKMWLEKAGIAVGRENEMSEKAGQAP